MMQGNVQYKNGFFILQECKCPTRLIKEYMNTLDRKRSLPMDYRFLRKLTVANKGQEQEEAKRRGGVFSMKSNGLFEIVVLRPTNVFLLFLTSQLPKELVPGFKCLQTDNTAYVIKKFDTKEDTLNELERLYTKMFRHEICRWLGSDARNAIEQRFLDFLCCFKLEFHSHLIALEPSLQKEQQMVQLKPRMKLLQWVQSMVAEQPDLARIMDQVTLPDLIENASVVVKKFNHLTEIKPFLRTCYPYLFETAMSRMSNQPHKWPKINSLEAFGNYFEIELHTQLISYIS
jgi:hypothetical protein